MTNVSQYLVNHLVTFSLEAGEVRGVEEAQARLALLARSERLWSQQMLLEVGPEAVRLKDLKTQEELEKYPVSSIYRCDSLLTEKRFPSLLQLVCQSADHKKPDVLFFHCQTVKAEQVRTHITGVVSDYSSKTRKPAEAFRPAPAPAGEMIDPYGIPNPPLPHAPNPPPPNPPPYPGTRAASGVNGGQPDISFLRAEREVGILNHCFDDIEHFMAKLQQAAEASTVLNQRKKKKKKSKKHDAEDDILTAKARPPSEAEFIDILQKFKYCLSLLARLKSAISNPSSEELLHHVFKPLDMLVKTTGGPSLAASVASPALTGSAVTLLQDNLNEEEKQLWTSLGSTWTLARSQLRSPIAPYTPAFLDGWKPESVRPDGQAWEDPVESQHHQEALTANLQRRPSQFVGPPQSVEIDSSVLPPEGERMYSCSYDFVARNSSELSVLQGETLEVVESSKRWWKCRNRFDEIGFVPFNILEPIAHIESPVANKPPKAPVPTPTSASSVVPPSPPAMTPHDLSSQRPRSLYAHNMPAAEDTDRAMLVNDELLQRLTNGKPGLNKPLVIQRSSDTSVPLDFHSPPAEVAQWLRGKGFSEPTVLCLGVLTGAQLFSLNKEELRAVIPEEGARVYSQLTVQKSLLEDARRSTELETVMEKQKMKVDLKTESSTL